jgi:hypothetical protein
MATVTVMVHGAGPGHSVTNLTSTGRTNVPGSNHDPER